MDNDGYFSEGKIDKFLSENIFTKPDYEGVIIEVGGATPEYLSMSRHFKLRGWRVVVIEPNPVFAKMQREIGNEVYECACADFESESHTFNIFHLSENGGEKNVVTDHSFSSLGVKDEFLNIGNGWVNSIPKTEIKIPVRKLDSIITEGAISKIDILSVDVEGWELEVMRGITKINPSIVILEDVTEKGQYNEFMSDRGYQLLKSVDQNFIYVHNKE